MIYTHPIQCTFFQSGSQNDHAIQKVHMKRNVKKKKRTILRTIFFCKKDKELLKQMLKKAPQGPQ